MATTEVLDSLSDAVGSGAEAHRASWGFATGRRRLSWRGVLGDGATVLVAWSVAIGVQVSLGNTLGAGRFWRNALHWGPSLGSLLSVVIISMMVLVLVSNRLHLYSLSQSISILHEQRLTIQACCTCGLLVSGFIYLLHDRQIPRSTVLVTLSFVTAALCLRRLIRRSILHNKLARGVGLKNVLIVGTGVDAVAMKNHLEHVRRLGYRFKGLVELTGLTRSGCASEAIKVDDLDEVFEFARTEFVEEIFVAAPHDPGLLRELLARSRSYHIDLRIIPDTHNGLVWDRPVEYIGQFPSIPLHTREIPHVSLLLKRVLDVILSSIGLLLMSPLMLLIGLLVKLDSPGPAFYRAYRIGRKGRRFKCTKFRTMTRDADSRRAEIMHLNEREGVLFKVSNDPRVTRIGRFLRKYSLDELPQLFDVLRGEMSLVGPRPPLASEVSEYLPRHLRRLDVMPGITGLWQIQARQDPSFDSYISLDLIYVETWSIWLDLKILARTIGVVLAGTGS